MGKIFYIMGKSASGKDKIYGKLLSDPELNLKKMVLYTTRPIRAKEIDGVQYFFVDDTVRKNFEKQKKIIECRSYDTIHGVWRYFTADDGQVDLETNNYLGIGTLDSYEKLKKYYGGQSVCPIYIEVEDGERLARALHREGKQAEPRYEEMCRRFLADQMDFSEEKIRGAGIDKRFYNIDLDQCIEEIKQYVLEKDKIHKI